MLTQMLVTKLGRRESRARQELPPRDGCGLRRTSLRCVITRSSLPTAPPRRWTLNAPRHRGGSIPLVIVRSRRCTHCVSYLPMCPESPQRVDTLMGRSYAVTSWSSISNSESAASKAIVNSLINIQLPFDVPRSSHNPQL